VVLLDGLNRKLQSIVAHKAQSSTMQSTKSRWNMCKPSFLNCLIIFQSVDALLTLLAEIGPTFIAVEPPELIGGDVSVTTADPSIVSHTVALVKGTNSKVRVLCGAGVKNGQDVATAIQLGAEGVLLASGVTKASNVESVLDDLVSLL
jgi:triosephosphate isomerase